MPLLIGTGRTISTTYAKNEVRHDAIAIICGDTRFPFFEKVVKEKIVGHNHVTIRAYAVGIAPFLNDSSRSSVVNDIKILSSLNDWARLIVVGHENCGYYKENYKNIPLDLLNIKILDDLKNTQKFFEMYDFLEKIIHFEAYFGYPTENGYNFKEIIL